MSAFFYLSCFQGSSMLQCASVLHFSLLLNYHSVVFYHLSIDRYFNCAHFIFITNNAVGYKILCR